jgi:hypothetical protein
MTRPPQAARWLLSHFGCSPNNDAIIGDLDERYQRGRSTVWYWRQVLATVVTSLWNELAAHKFLTMEAIVHGWLQFLALGYGLVHLYSRIGLGSMSPMLRVPPPRDWSPSSWWIYAGMAFQPPWMILHFALLACVASAWSGIVVGVNRLHPQRRAMFLAYFASRCIHTIATCCFFLVGAIYVPEYVAVLVSIAAGNIVALVAVILPGGVLNLRSGSDALVRM